MPYLRGSICHRSQELDVYKRQVRRSSLLPADGIAAELIDRLVADLAPAAHRGIVLLINNLGATPSMELAIVARAALRLSLIHI